MPTINQGPTAGAPAETGPATPPPTASMAAPRPGALAAAETPPAARGTAAYVALARLALRLEALAADARGALDTLPLPDAPRPGAPAAADWDLTQPLSAQDVEDGEAASKAANAFFKRPLDYVRGGEVPVHCYFAGFSRGRAWAMYRGVDRLRDAQAFRAAARMVEALRDAPVEEIARTLYAAANELLRPPAPKTGG